LLGERRVDPRSFYPPRDRVGVKQLHRLELPGLLRAVPDFMSQFRAVVPEEFYAEDMDGETPIIVVSCRCGKEPVLRFRQRSYSLARCGCGRHFLFDGQNLRSSGGDS
jgi:hypothetical protein